MQHAEAGLYQTENIDHLVTNYFQIYNQAAPLLLETKLAISKCITYLKPGLLHFLLKYLPMYLIVSDYDPPTPQLFKSLIC